MDVWYYAKRSEGVESDRESVLNASAEIQICLIIVLDDNHIVRIGA